jgi:hypothetical protein
MNENKKQEYSRNLPHSFFFPLLLIAIGVIYLLYNFKVIQGNAGELFAIYWPVFFIIGGLDGLYRREGFASALVGIGVGSVLLLGNLGYLGMRALPLLLRIWPFFLLGWGVDLAVGRGRSWVSITLGVLLGGALVAGMFWVVGFPGLGSVAYQQQNLVQDLQGAARGDVSVDLTTGSLQIEAGAKSANLAEIGLKSISRETIDSQYEVNQGLGTFRLANTSTSSVPVFPFGNTSDLAWDLKLNGEIPLTLNSKVVAGEQIADLSGLNLNEFTIETTVGNADISLPEADRPDGQIEVTLGELIIRVPQGVPVRIELESGLTSVSLPDGYTQNGNLITSSETGSAADTIDLKVNMPLGIFRVEYSH